MNNSVEQLKSEIDKLKKINSELETQLLEQGKISAGTISHLFEAFLSNDLEKITNYGLFIGEFFQANEKLKLSAKIINTAVTSMNDPDKIIKHCPFEEPEAYSDFVKRVVESKMLDVEKPFEIFFEFFGGEKRFGLYEYDVFKNGVTVTQEDFDYSENIQMSIRQGSKSRFFKIRGENK